MKQTYSISGMTCGGCVAAVTDSLMKVNGVEEAEVDLASSSAHITMGHPISLSSLKSALPDKYGITEHFDVSQEIEMQETKSKWQQLRPLFLIFAYLFGASILLHLKDWNTNEAMLDFMGLFYIVFSFFKFLDLKGFPSSFAMYDPLARAVPFYGWLYPFIELGLGLLFLMRLELQFALIATIIILGITTFGVVRTLLDKKQIRCACLGTALNLPMTEATFIENAIMLLMAFWMVLA